MVESAVVGAQPDQTSTALSDGFLLPSRELLAVTVNFHALVEVGVGIDRVRNSRPSSTTFRVRGEPTTIRADGLGV